MNHNYFLGWATDYQFAGWTLREIETGFNHESNGRAEPTSRSWNRVYAVLWRKKVISTRSETLVPF